MCISTAIYVSPSGNCGGFRVLAFIFIISPTRFFLNLAHFTVPQHIALAHSLFTDTAAALKAKEEAERMEREQREYDALTKRQKEEAERLAV